MPVTSIDLDDGLASLLAGDLSPLDSDISGAANTPAPVGWGEAARAAIQALITRASGVYYDVDLSTLANNTLTDGTEVIDSLNWTAANMASLGTAAVQNGTGLRFSAGTSLGAASTFTTSSQVAPHIYLPLSSIPNYDPRFGLIVEAYVPTRTLESNGEGVFIGLFGPASSPHTTSAARVRWVGKFNNSGTEVVRTTTTATAQNSTDSRSTHDVIGFRLTETGLGSAWSGVYASGFPRAVSAAIPFVSLAGVLDPFNSDGVRLVIGCAVANDASPTTTVVIRRLRIRRG